ncbi:MAG: uncharacterized protein K0R17_864 [Rariglobus sp.]|jgi:TPR repeat protein|nr:uncharacterized protein [Rariglobus sp.]
MKPSRLCSAFGLCCVSLLVSGPRAHAEDDEPLSLAALHAKAEAGDVQAWVELGQRYELGEQGLEQDYAKARAWYQKAAAKDNGYAAFQLAAMARAGDNGKEPDPADAFRWMQKAAGLGFPGAHVELGAMHQHGEGTPRNLVESLKAYLKGAELNDAEAQFRAGMAFAEGRGTKKDLLTAAKWLARAAAGHDEASAKLRELLAENPDLDAKLEAQAPEVTKQLLAKAAKGDAEAQMALVELYSLGGGGLAPSQATALKWLRAAAAAGNADAQFGLGKRILWGDATENETGATEWFKKAAAQKMPEAFYELGLSYRIGQQVEKDPVESLKWFRGAADLGHVDAKRHVALAYQNGWGVPADVKEAARWFADAANHGHTPSMYALAMIVLEEGELKDSALARKWLTRASELNDGDAKEALDKLDDAENEAKFTAQIPPAVTGPTRALFLNALRGNADAQFKLGVTFGYGNADGLRADPAEQLKWFKLAAEQGHVFAQRNLGQVLMTGKDVPRDDAEAFKWMQRAAEQKDADACYYLGVLYREGRGTARNSAEAARWLKLSADGGRHSARMDLAALLLAGDGVDKNEAEAVALLVKTADEKNGEAMWRLSQLYARGVNGAAPDAAKAHELIVKAGGLGHPEAKSRLAELATAANAEKLAAIEREFQTAFSAATTMGDRKKAIVVYSRAMGEFRYSENLTQPQICEKVLAVLRPKMEANLAEAGEYAMAINSLVFDNATLQRVLPAHVTSRIKAHAQEVSAAYQRREEALQPIRTWIPKAEAGDLHAQMQIAEGLLAAGPAQDVPGAIKWFQRAADAGHAPARQRLGKILYDDALAEEKAGRKDTSRLGFEKSAGYGNTDAMLLLAARHVSGAYGKEDAVAAKAWAEKAIAAGDKRGTDLLQLFGAVKDMGARETFDAALKAYDAKDFAAALAGWEKGAAAGDAYAMFALGVLYERGEGVKTSYVTAKSWYEKAQAAGHPKAAESVQAMIGYTIGLDELAKGDAEAKAKNMEKALEWYLKSAELGNINAMIAAGGLYYAGEGTEKNPRKALAWYEKAAATGDAMAQMFVTTTKESLAMSDLVESQKNMKKLRDRIDGVAQVETPAAVGAKTGVKDLRKNSPWTTDDMLAALKAGADHNALAKAIEHDKTAVGFNDFELKRLLNTPEGRRIESFGPLSTTLHGHSRQGAGAWAHELAKTAIEARRQQVGRVPKVIDTPELRAKAAAGDVGALFALTMLPMAERKLGPVASIHPDELRKKIVEANYAPAFHYAADAFRNNSDKSRNDPVKYADYLWKAAEAGSPEGMRALGMLFVAPGETCVASNYAEAEYWLIEAAARAREGTMEDLYNNPGRDVAFLYSFTTPLGGPQSWPLSSADEATLRWARELIRRGGKLAEVAEVSLTAIERETRAADVRAKLAALPPEVSLWSANEVARLDKAARAGDTSAALKLGEACASGRGVRQQDVRAVEYYELAAAGGSAKAMRALAWHCEKGFGVKKNAARRVTWLEKAGAAGDASAWREVGDLHQFYNEDKSIGQNYPRALAAYEKAIAAGDIPALHQLGMMHEEGRGVPKNLTKAGELYRTGAEGGHANAQRRFAQMLDAEKKFAEAAIWFGKAADGGAFGARHAQARMLAKAGNLGAAFPVYRRVVTEDPAHFQAQMEFGLLLEQRKELAEAAKAYRAVIAVNSDYNVYREEAKTRLAAIESQPAPPSDSDAALRKQAEAGDPNAMLAYAHKIGNTRNAEALEWVKKAAEKGQADAMLLLAGNLMATNKPVAIQWMQKSADAGNLEAKLRLGAAMLQGSEVPRDQAGGLKLVTAAADGGFAPAQFELGRLFVTGGPDLMPQPARGVELLKKAAAQNLPAAMAILGEIYEKGVSGGIPADPREALKWYEQALKAGVQQVRPAVERLRITLGGKTPPPDKK